MPKLVHTLTLIVVGAAIGGCGIANPYQHAARPTSLGSTSMSTASSPASNRAQNPGEPPAPQPPSASSQGPAKGAGHT